jgi:hypothetical protein
LVIFLLTLPDKIILPREPLLDLLVERAEGQCLSHSEIPAYRPAQFAVVCAPKPVWHKGNQFQSNVFDQGQTNNVKNNVRYSKTVLEVISYLMAYLSNIVYHLLIELPTKKAMTRPKTAKECRLVQVELLADLIKILNIDKNLSLKILALDVNVFNFLLFAAVGQIVVDSKIEDDEDG